MRAYVLIDSSEGNARKIAAVLRQRSEVLLADVINGPHPVIALLEGDDPAVIARTVLFDIRRMEGITDLTVYLSLQDSEDASGQVTISHGVSFDRFSNTGGEAKHSSRCKGAKTVHDGESMV